MSGFKKTDQEIIKDVKKAELFDPEHGCVRGRTEEFGYPLSLYDKYLFERKGKELIIIGIQILLQGLCDELGMYIGNENFRETPERVARAYLEMLSGEKDTQEQIDEILKKSFPSEYNGMVIGSNIHVYSMCPHHLLPVSYIVNVGYIPNDKVIGASKLSRLVKVLAKRAVLQEDFTKDIADNLMNGIKAAGVIAQVYGKHLCMGCRGIEQSQSSIVTSEIRGSFEQKETREEFALLVKGL